MALSFAQLADQGNMSLDGTPTSVVDVTLDTSYPTGGYLAASGLTAANLNCGRGINGMSWIGNNAAAVGYVPEFNTDTGALEILSGALAQVAGGTNLSTLSFRFLVIGQR